MITRRAPALTEIAALVDHRRPGGRSAIVARQLAAWGRVPVTNLDVLNPPRRFPRGVLLVADAHGGGPPGDVLFDRDAEHLLQRLPAPALVLGPHAGELFHPPHLLVPLDRSGLAGVSAAAVTGWIERFPSTTVSLLGLDAPGSWPEFGPPPQPDDADDVLDTLQHLGADVTLQRVDRSDPAGAILAVADRSMIIVVTTSRWPSGPGHWFSTTRDLIRHAHCPVLVVPDQVDEQA